MYYLGLSGVAGAVLLAVAIDVSVFAALETIEAAVLVAPSSLSPPPFTTNTASTPGSIT